MCFPPVSAEAQLPAWPELALLQLVSSPLPPFFSSPLSDVEPLLAAKHVPLPSCVPVLHDFSWTFHTCIIAVLTNCYCSVGVREADKLYTSLPLPSAGALAPLSPVVVAPLSSFRPGDGKLPLDL